MARIAKVDVNRALEQAAKTIIQAGGADGKISRAEVKARLPQLKGPEKKLVDMFFRFIDHRDFKLGAQVTPADVKKAVAYAKEHLVAKYDLDNNGLSKDEIKKMSLTGKLAVDLAKALKQAPAPAPESVVKKFQTFGDLLDGVKTEKEVTFTRPDQVPPELKKMIIDATHQASYTDTVTLKDAFEAVDQGEFVVRNLKDPATGEKLISIDFGAGDNTYGGIFSPAGKLLAQIHDGDLEAK
ncbi:MAG: Nuclease inhibitor-like protein [Myxococcaceae bacterium]|nr:Nuclease inhibitor-like protein [Myxococcaceae bacterium]